MSLATTLNGIITFISNLISVIFDVINSLLNIFLNNKYVFENDPGSYIGYLIVMFLIFCGIVFLLFQIFIFIKEILDNYVETNKSVALSIALLIEVLGLVFNVVTFEIFSIVAEIVTLAVMFYIISILPNLFSGESEPRRRR